MSSVAPQPAETGSCIGNTAIVFDPQLLLSEKKKDKIVNWPVLKDKLAARQKSGFNISQIVVKDAAFLGPKNDKLTLLYAQFCYTDINGTLCAYYGVVMPDGAGLLEVFRVAGKENTKVKYFAKMVVQDRVVINAPKSLEAPLGFIETGEMPAEASRREHMEETGALKGAKGKLTPLGSVAFHQAVANRVHLFLIVHDVTSKKFNSVRKLLLNKKGGLKEEGEMMDVKLMPLHKAYEEICVSGNSACAEIHLGRAMDFLKIRRPTIAFQ